MYYITFLVTAVAPIIIGVVLGKRVQPAARRMFWTGLILLAVGPFLSLLYQVVWAALIVMDTSTGLPPLAMLGIVGAVVGVVSTALLITGLALALHAATRPAFGTGYPGTPSMTTYPTYGEVPTNGYAAVPVGQTYTPNQPGTLGGQAPQA